MSGADERDLLDRLMAEEGVVPTGGRRRAPEPRRASPPPAPAPAPAVAREAYDAVQSELQALRQTLAARDTELALLRTRAAAHATALSERDARIDALDQERRALARQLQDLRDQPPPAPPPSLAPLRARGLPEGAEADVLAELLVAFPDPTLAALDGPAEGLAALLAERVVRTCQGPDCAVEPASAVAVVVAPEACELCGGSDIQAAWRAFEEACALVGHHKVVIVGGSPAYRRQLKALAKGASVKLELVDGTKKPSTRRIGAQARTADLVVFWCATMLNHTTTEAYTSAGASPLLVPHRGIATMLRFVAAALS